MMIPTTNWSTLVSVRSPFTLITPVLGLMSKKNVPDVLLRIL